MFYPFAVKMDTFKKSRMSQKKLPQFVGIKLSIIQILIQMIKKYIRLIGCHITKLLNPSNYDILFPYSIALVLILFSLLLRNPITRSIVDKFLILTFLIKMHFQMDPFP